LQDATRKNSSTIHSAVTPTLDALEFRDGRVAANTGGYKL